MLISEENTSPENSNFKLSGDKRWSRYFDLSRPDIEVCDKLYACYMFENEETINGKWSYRKFAEAHNVKRSTLADWMRHYEDYKTRNVLTMTKKRGRSPLIDEKGLEELSNAVSSAVKRQKTPDRSEVIGHMTDAVTSTYERKGLSYKQFYVSLNTEKKYRRITDMKKGKVQHKTKARRVAEADVRNVLSMHCLVNAFCQTLKPNMIGNFDATQFVISQENADEGYYIKQERENDDEPPPEARPLTAESTGLLSFAVKYYHVNNAAGFCSNPVFVVSDPTMTDKEFKFSRINGLGSSTSQLDNYGWLCITKTRACNPEFYTWFVTKVLIEFMQLSRTSSDGYVSLIIFNN